MHLGPHEFQILLCKAIVLWAYQYYNWREIRGNPGGRGRSVQGGGGHIFFSQFFESFTFSTWHCSCVRLVAWVPGCCTGNLRLSPHI